MDNTRSSHETQPRVEEALRYFKKYLVNGCPNCGAPHGWLCRCSDVWVCQARIDLIDRKADNEGVREAKEKLSEEFNKLSEQFIKYSVAHHNLIKLLEG